MKTSILRTVCIAFSMFLVSNFVVKAQESFYDTKWEEGKMVSRTKYLMGYSGLYEQESVSKYTYDENGDFLEKEVYAWNRKYAWNDKAGRQYPDYSESNWMPQYRILQKNDLTGNFVSMELLLWNKLKKDYDNPVEKIIFQLNASNMFTYLAFQKDNKYVEWVNSINQDRRLLAGLIE